MNLDNIYILNPAYYLRNDIHRVLLGSYPKYSSEIPHEEVLSIIHPHNAQLLACFDGKRTLGECIKCLTSWFDLDEDTIKGLISIYIENSESFTIRIAERYMYFPTYVLVNTINTINTTRKENYSITDFDIEDIDLKTERLYIPNTVLFNLTYKCKTDCLYCYADRTNPKQFPLLTLKRVREIIQEAKQIGVKEFDINGGEVLLHEQYEEIIKELIQNDFPPLISTKIPIKQDVIEKLKNLGINDIQVSLDSVNPSTLNHLLGVNGEEYLIEMKKTLQLLEKAEIELTIHAVLTSQNTALENEIIPLLQELFTHKNITHITLSPAGYSIYKDRENYEQLKPQEYAVELLEEYIDKLSSQHPEITFELSDWERKSEYCSKNRSKLFSARSACSGNQCAMVILPNGDVTLCEELYWHPKLLLGNISKNSIMQVWSSQQAKDLFWLNQQQLSNDSACKTCSQFDTCRHGFGGSCWKLTVMAYGYGHWDYPDPRCPNAPEMINDICLFEK